MFGHFPNITKHQKTHCFHDFRTQWTWPWLPTPIILNFVYTKLFQKGWENHAFRVKDSFGNINILKIHMIFFVACSRSQWYRMSHVLLHLTRIHACTKELAILLSVLILVSFCGWPIASNILRMPIAAWAFWKRPPHSASAAEQTIFLAFGIRSESQRCLVCHSNSSRSASIILEETSTFGFRRRTNDIF